MAARNDAGEKDRIATLMVVGALNILLGLVVLGLAALMFMTPILLKNAPAQAQQAQPVSMVTLGFFYCAVAAMFGWLGGGLILARRWARTLGLILYWNGFIIGILCLVAMIFFIPIIFENMENQPGMTEGVLKVMRGVLGFMGVVYVFIPGAQVWALSGKNVKDTCESRNPDEAWTDSCPPLVLNLCLFAGLSALSFISMNFLYVKPLFLFFNTILEGPSAVVASVILTALFLWTALDCYRLNLRGWWTLMGLHFFLIVNVATCLSNGGLLELYKKMGMPDVQIQMISTAISNHWFVGFTLLTLVWGTVIGYMLYCKKYFTAAAKD